GIFVKYVPGVHLLCVAATIVLPHAFIKAVMKVEIFEILELGTRGGEKLLAKLDMAVHRAANIEEDQHIDLVTAFRHQLDVEITLMRGCLDGAVEVQLGRRAFAGEAAQAAERHLDVARAKLD